MLTARTTICIAVLGELAYPKIKDVMDKWTVPMGAMKKIAVSHVLIFVIRCFLILFNDANLKKFLLQNINLNMER